MDETLRQILAALFQAHQEVANTRQRVKEIEAELATLKGKTDDTEQEPK